MPKGDTSRPYGKRLRAIAKAMPGLGLKTSKALEGTRKAGKVAGVGRRVSPALGALGKKKPQAARVECPAVYGSYMQRATGRAPGES